MAERMPSLTNTITKVHDDDDDDDPIEVDDVFVDDQNIRIGSVQQQSETDQKNPPPTEKKILSKFIQRLIHPKELRDSDNVVVIQSPEIIPLNDTFILDFGRRIKQDEIIYNITPLNIDHTIHDNDDDDDDDDAANRKEDNNNCSIERQQKNDTDITVKSNKKLPRKVKITNIKYTTTAKMIELILEEQFGVIEYMNLIMQPSSSSSSSSLQETNKKKNSMELLNSGLAYVTFVEASAANQCVNELKTLDQRPVSVTLLSNSGNGGNTHNNNNNNTNHNTSNTNNSNNRRYWSEIDLSIKCYNCGQTGHRSYECTGIVNNNITTDDSLRITPITPCTNIINGKKPRRPCPLCANRIDHSEIYQCPYRNVCFNCGIPGHISRECKQTKKPYNNNNNNNQIILSRCVCTVCYTMNHHTKYNCPWWIRNQQQQQHNNNRTPTTKVHPTIHNISTNAICMTCGTLGHFLCHELKWFYGLYGISCGNCGMPGHNYTQCPRPNLEVCSRNEDILLLEIERAATIRSVEQSIMDANSKESLQSPKQQQQQQQYRGNDNQQQQHRQNDMTNRYQRGDSNGAATTQQGQQSRYGSIDRSRSSSNNNNNNDTQNTGLHTYDRGRQMHRPQQQQPQFRPMKSMPPPNNRQQSNYNNNDNNNNNRSRYKSDSQNHNHQKRNRNGNGNNDNDLELSSPQHKRRRPN